MSDDYVIHLITGDVRITSHKGLVEFEKGSIENEWEVPWERVMTVTSEQAVDLAHALIRMAVA